MEVPKDYSTLYSDEKAPVPATRESKLLDGFSTRRRREFAGGIDPNDLISKLYQLSEEQREAYAMRNLKQHHTCVFKNRNQPKYKVSISYFEDGQKFETYWVRITRNTLGHVRAKLPIKGEFRLFFLHPGGDCEEVEDDDVLLPCYETESEPTIHCRVFRK